MAIALHFYFGKKRREKLAQVADGLGFSFDKTCPSPDELGCGHLDLFQKGRSRRGRNLIRGTLEDVQVCVPIMRAHAESINLTFDKPLAPDEARDILRNAPGVSVIDDAAANRFPTPLDAAERDDVYVGRLRQDHSLNGQATGGALNLFVCGDQLRKGAALNAVQIAELLLR